MIFREKQLQQVLNLYAEYFNRARPHQGILQQLPEPSRSAISSHYAGDKLIAVPILGELHHDYQRVA
jgi:putative transposase